MTFAHPSWLVAAVLAVAAFAWLYTTLERRRDAQALVYSNLDFALGAMRPSRLPATAMLIAALIGVGSLAASLAGPRFTARVPTRDGVAMICIDTSGSMRARDVSPTRWEAARAAARAFIDAVPPGTHVGIVSFSSGANIIQPPTDDLDAARDALDRIPPPNGGTAIGDALEAAATQLPAKGRRAIVLLTDGVNNRGADPLEASRQIGAKGVVISTVGIGTSGSGEIIPGTNELADIDEQALRTIASNGQGEYAQATNAAELSAIFRRIALDTVWEKKRIDASLPLALGGGMLLLATFLAGLATGKLP
jgi:Ca-activated chloride channel family protein